MKRKSRRRRPGARYYGGDTAGSSTSIPHFKLHTWPSSRQNEKPLGRWEWLSLALVLIGGLVALALPFWPGTQWPEVALWAAGAAALAILGILAFFIAYLRARTP